MAERVALQPCAAAVCDAPCSVRTAPSGSQFKAPAWQPHPVCARRRHLVACELCQTVLVCPPPPCGTLAGPATPDRLPVLMELHWAEDQRGGLASPPRRSRPPEGPRKDPFSPFFSFISHLGWGTFGAASNHSRRPLPLFSTSTCSTMVLRGSITFVAYSPALKLHVNCLNFFLKLCRAVSRPCKTHATSSRHLILFLEFTRKQCLRYYFGSQLHKRICGFGNSDFLSRKAGGVHSHSYSLVVSPLLAFALLPPLFGWLCKFSGTRALASGCWMIFYDMLRCVTLRARIRSCVHACGCAFPLCCRVVWMVTHPRPQVSGGRPVSFECQKGPTLMRRGVCLSMNQNILFAADSHLLTACQDTWPGLAACWGDGACRIFDSPCATI
mmetsp:Transcript_61981/g.102919  ORF Transcript_61981/g.102919 Transcript_61981/m.102919 type:complete len:384 (+) Transcript_61981:229-1380(+)